MRPPSTIGAIISVMLFGSVGLGLLTFAISSYKDGVGFKQKGIATIATVVKSEKDTDNDGDIFYHLNLRFLTRDGRTFEAIKNSANPSQDFPNNRGSIIYDSTNPGRVSVNSDLSNLEAGFWIFGGIGLFVAFTGFYSLLNYFSKLQIYYRLSQSGRRQFTQLVQVKKWLGYDDDLYRTISEWTDPGRGKTFKSEASLTDPQPYIKATGGVEVLHRTSTVIHYISPFSTISVTTQLN